MIGPELVITVASLGALIAAYVLVAMTDGSWVNALTPSFVVFVPSNYLVTIYSLLQTGPTASTYAYALTFSSYAAFYVAFVLAYVKVRTPTFRLPFAPPERPSRIPAYLTFGLAVALYMPVMLEYRHLLLDPRRIYELTRSGYGLNFFLSTALCYLAVVLSLFGTRMNTVERVVFLVASMIFLWLHGSKAHMLTILMILALYVVYVRQIKVGLATFFAFSLVMFLVGILLFLVTNPDLLKLGVQGLVGYSSYTDNGMLVIDSGIGPYLGKITVETELFTRVPRLLFPDKPSDFGQFLLAQHFYPDIFAGGTGAPAFGYGSLFADFGSFTIVVVLVFGFVNGVLLKLFATSLKRRRGAGEFILFLFAAGISLIPFTGVFLLPESLVLATAANAVHAFRIKGRSRVTDGFATNKPRPSSG